MNSTFWRFIVVLQELAQKSRSLEDEGRYGLPFNTMPLSFYNFCSSKPHHPITLAEVVKDLRTYFDVLSLKDMQKAWSVLLAHLSDVMHLMHPSIRSGCERIAAWIAKEVSLLEAEEERVTKLKSEGKKILNGKIARPTMCSPSLEPNEMFLSPDFRPPPGLLLPPGFQSPPGLPHPLHVLPLLPMQ